MTTTIVRLEVRDRRCSIVLFGEDASDMNSNSRSLRPAFHLHILDGQIGVVFIYYKYYNGDAHHDGW